MTPDYPPPSIRVADEAARAEAEGRLADWERRLSEKPQPPADERYSEWEQQ